MTRVVRAAFWIGVYLVLVMAPVFLLLTGPEAAAGGFWIEFAVALGFAAASLFAGIDRAPARGTSAGTTGTGERAAPFGPGAPSPEPAADTVPGTADGARVALGRELFRSVDPGVRKPAYDDLPPEEVDAMVAYLQSLTGDG